MTLELHDLIDHGLSESTLADDLRDQMDIEWNQLLPSEKKVAKNVSASIYRTPKVKAGKEHVWRSVTDIPDGLDVDGDDMRCVVVWQDSEHPMDIAIVQTHLRNIVDGDFDNSSECHSRIKNAYWRLLTDAPPFHFVGAPFGPSDEEDL